METSPFWQNWEFWTAIATLFLGIATFALVSTTRALVKSSDDNAKREQRAYVWANIIKYTVADGAPVECHFKAYNSGKTPAKKVQIRRYVGAVSWPIGRGPLRIRFEESEGEPSLFPDDKDLEFGAISDFNFDRNTYKEALSWTGKTRICVFVRIDYEDIFNEAHWTTIAFSYEPNAQPNGVFRWVPIIGHNGFS